MVLFSQPTSAHQMNLSNARVVARPDGTVELELSFKGTDIDRAAGTSVFDTRTELVDPARLVNATPVIAAYLTTHAEVRGADGTVCRPGAVTVAPDQDGVFARMSWSCREVEGDLVYRSTAIVDVDTAAKQVVLIGNGPNLSQALLDASQTEVRLGKTAPTLLHVILRYVGAGVEHVFLGYDHITFLIAIVLWGRQLWPVIKIVAAFTIAYSITLWLAALQIVVIPNSIADPAIAASIVYVAVENFFSRDIDRRWRASFCFGLIHGFGFASALQEFGLPRGAVVPALGAFNLGVELGQVAIVSLVIPTLIGLDRLLGAPRGVAVSRSARLVYSLSGIIAVLGCYWIFKRTIGV
jgi:hydrogenase/urease accessory protein HupE